MSQRRDPVAALRAIVESNKRYVALTGHDLDVVALHPGHAAELLEIIDKLQHPLAAVTHVRLNGATTEEHADALRKALEKMPHGPLMRTLRSATYKHACKWEFGEFCTHDVTTHFPSDGSTYCHDCRKTWTDAEPESHRRVSSVERSG